MCFASVQSTHFASATASAKALAIRPALRAAAHLGCSDTRPGDFCGTAAAAGTEGGGITPSDVHVVSASARRGAHCL